MRRAALEALRDAIFAALAPAEAAGLLTALHIETGRAQEALAAWAECERCAPHDPYTMFLRARIALLDGERRAALDLLLPLMDAPLSPAIGEKVYNIAGQCARFLGRAQEAVAFYARARDAAPDLALKALNASNVLFNRHYLPATLAEDRAAAEEYGALFRAVQQCDHAAHRRGARLRIGYLSPDVREHVVLSFSYALMTALDPARFEVTVYALNAEDGYTEQVKAGVAHFRNLARLSAEEAAQVIYRDGIDILVDLAGHTAGRTLPILAHRPAPVQISGIGYFASTGLSTVDYFLADPILAAETGFTEELLVLPATHFCWQPLHSAPAPDHAPAAGRGVVFGSFNNFSKVTDEVLRLWGTLLDTVPNARLLLKSKLFGSAEGREVAAERFARYGIPAECVEMRGFDPNHRAEYADMDIALDTFPYTGGITTCEALAMGVPVVTLCGTSHGARFGESLLINANLPELVAKDPADYVQIARTLASSSETLCALRMNLRAILAHAPLTDARTYVRDVEAAYAEIRERFVRTAGRM